MFISKILDNYRKYKLNPDNDDQCFLFINRNAHPVFWDLLP